MNGNGQKPPPKATVASEYVIERNGKKVVLYRGLLDLAHVLGLAAIATELIQLPEEANGRVAVVKARVTMKDGATFEGYGDADPKNVGPMVRDALLRMAETRAKARALRDAVNIGDVSFEELAEPEEVERTTAPYRIPPLMARYLAVRAAAEKEAIAAPEHADFGALTDAELIEEGKALVALTETSKKAGCGKLYAEALHAGLDLPRLKLGDDIPDWAAGARQLLDAAKALP